MAKVSVLLLDLLRLFHLYAMLYIPFYHYLPYIFVISMLYFQKVKTLMIKLVSTANTG